MDRATVNLCQRIGQESLRLMFDLVERGDGEGTALKVANGELLQRFHALRELAPHVKDGGVLYRRHLAHTIRVAFLDALPPNVPIDARKMFFTRFWNRVQPALEV